MTPELIVALLSLIGTCIGSVAGILTANHLTNYKIDQLTARVDKHNGLVERMVVVEQSTKSAHHRIDEMKGE